MRSDMKKVLCERPRSNSAAGYHEVRQYESRGDYEGLPAHQGMRRPYKRLDNKNFNDHIGPLRAYLRSCVGRRWDDVFSEICANVPADTTVGDHLRQHVKWECVTDCHVVDGKVYEFSPYSGLREPRGLYVDPRDGIVHVNDNKRPKYDRIETVDGLHYRRKDDLLLPAGLYRRGASGKYPLKVIGDQRAMQIDGIWYWIMSDMVPASYEVTYNDHGTTCSRKVTFSRYDIIRGIMVTEGRYYCAKKQMASRDLRQNGLYNGLTPTL